MKIQNLNEETKKISQVLIERFGTPIGDSPSTVGVPDERNENEKLDEVTPKGYESIVKGLKKDPDVENPWAIAWSMKKKGIKPKRKSKK
jgi:hypothetical protein